MSIMIRPSIIRYLEPLTGDLFTARFPDCPFDETFFPSLRGDKNINVHLECCELLWIYSHICLILDLRTYLVWN